MRLLILGGLGLAIGAYMAMGCGFSPFGGSSGSTSGSSAPTISDVGDLPLASSKVVSAASSNLSKSLTKALASTGLGLATMSSSSFTAQSSLAMCENANILKSAFNGAVQGDVILCYVKAMDTAFAAIGGLNVYDGSPHTFKLVEDGNNDFRVKMKITKNTAGSITDFQMWSCVGDTQREYLHQAISGTDFVMTSKLTEGLWSDVTTVTGTLNSSGQFTSKTIASSNSYTEANSSGYGTRTVVQGAESATISAWDKGSWSWNGGSGTFSRNFCSEAELLSTDTLATIAVGSGAARGNDSGTYSGGSYNDDFSEGWNGDTKVAGSNAILSSLSCTIPTLGTETTIAFTGDEVYDCSLVGATTLTVDEDQVTSTCSDLAFDWDWINCWDIIRPAPDPEPETETQDTTAPTLFGVEYSGGNAQAMNSGGVITNVSTATTGITMTFNEAMDTATVTTDTVTLTCGTAQTITIISTSATVFVAAPEGLPPQTSCTLTVGTGVTDSAGNALASASTTTFTTGCNTNEDSFTTSTFNNCWTTEDTDSVTLSVEDGGLLSMSTSTDPGLLTANVYKSFGAVDITVEVAIMAFSGLNSSTDECGIIINNGTGSKGTGYGLFITSDGTDLRLNSRSLDGTSTNSASLATGSDSSALPETLFLKVVKSGTTFTPSYRVGGSGDFTAFDAAKTVTLGSDESVNLSINSDGTGTTNCQFRQFVVTGASATGQD